MLVTNNRHHEYRVPVYASSYFSSKKDDYKQSIRKIDEVHKAKTVATVNGKSLDYSWLRGAAETYHLSPNIEDYILTEVPAVTVGIPNRNLHAFPYEEVTYFDPKFGRFVYQTFIGKCTFVDHCFPAGTQITMADGSTKPIEEINVGDEVITHNLKSKKVTETFKNGKKSLMKIKIQGVMDDLELTSNHPVYVVAKQQVYGRKNKLNQTQPKLRFSDFREREYTPHWREADDLYVGDYLCIPINYGGEVEVDPNLAFLVGAYLADGCILNNKGKQNTVLYTVGSHEKEFRDRIIQAAEQLGYRPYLREQQTQNCDWVMINSREFCRLMDEHVGQYSHLKRLKNPVRAWNRDSTKIMLGAYMTGDGHFHKTKGCFRVRSSSPQLLRDIQQAFAFVGIPSTTGIDCRAENISARAIGSNIVVARYDSGYVRINQAFVPQIKDYVIGKIQGLRESKSDSTCGIVTDKYLLMPILKIEKDVRTADVYNFEVEDDHTYIANNVVVHNCNKNPIEAKGIIFDASLRKVPGWDVWKIYTLLGYDRTKDAALAKQIERGTRRSYSMGAWVSYFINSITGQIENNSPRALKYPKGTVVSGRLSYQLCAGVDFFEMSSVDGPADVCAESHQLWYF